MIEQQGRVIAVGARDAVIETLQQGGCGHCKLRGGCGQRLIGEIGGIRRERVHVDNALKARVGDEVVVGIAESALLRASLQVYLMPLLGLVIGAIVGTVLLGLGDAGTVLTASLGLGFAVLTVRLSHSTATAHGFKPELLRISSADPDIGPDLSPGAPFPEARPPRRECDYPWPRH